ncbi:tRNA (cytidine(34)-2'-O)-methyltransferase [Actinotalea sp. K2]|uniref:tRNA (cytidine(34)-2'-O)-methyltransferase n=1 Tax=Actinotalea sp. K2 TaxID=2939438 RepID=UPI002016C112|nr:tRNA (cytidine(34)-2'-O)-methyltransferase [Actinotalea sp. K2]MCL3859509.1 tRNA (cytidine(34)-2'-O)-methyltransferase [Actinotalea sp. K2]
MLNVMFFEPRIAGNTGSAIRTSAATGSALHLVEPLGFDLSEPKLRRAGLDYHDLAHVVVHPDLDTALAALPTSRVLAFTTQAGARFTDVAYRPDDVLLFGPEPSGLPPEVLAHPRVTEQVRIPMLAGRRSLNLSNCAAVATYEAWRQLGFAGAV